MARLSVSHIMQDQHVGVAQVIGSGQGPWEWLLLLAPLLEKKIPESPDTDVTPIALPQLHKQVLCLHSFLRHFGGTVFNGGREGSWDTDLQAADACSAGPGPALIPGNERKKKK